MPKTHQEYLQLERRKQRSRSKLATQQVLPRLSVFRSLRSISVQIIDDSTSRTLATASDHSIKATGTKVERAAQLGTAIAKQALELKILAVRFDRGAYKYHGRVAALANAAREAGLQL